MYKNIYFILLFFLLLHCSIDNKSGIWEIKQNLNNKIKYSEIDFNNKITFEEFKKNVILFSKKSKYPNIIDYK